MIEDGLSKSPSLIHTVDHEMRIKTCADLLVEQLFEKRGILILDCDGVIFQSTSLHEPLLTTTDVIETFGAFESAGGQMGLATARSDHAILFLRERGIQLAGPLILEGGHVVIVGERKTILASDAYREFIVELRQSVERQTFFNNSWADVVMASSKSRNSIAICHGDRQWNGACRATFWYDWRGESEPGAADLAIQQMVIPRVHDVASAIGLSENDYNVKLSRMDIGLGIIRVGANVDGVPISKEHAAEHIWDGFDVVYAADGAGDSGFERDIRTRHKGKVIAIGGSHDLTLEVPDFTDHADVRLSDPSEFVQAMKHAIQQWI